MKKLLALLLVAVMAFSMVGCSQKIEESNASDTQLQRVIDAANTYFSSDVFKGYVEDYEKTFEETTHKPEITVAFTFEYDDVYGRAYDLILLNAKAKVRFEKNGEVHVFDSLQIIIDNKTGIAYDSLTYVEECNNFMGEVNEYEDAIIGFLNSGALIAGNNDYLWSELETSTRFTKDNIKTINAALN